MSKESTITISSTKDQIIQAALDLFYQQGVHWVSFKQIADQVEISQPAIYRHFKDKDDLVVACILKAAQSGRHMIDEVVFQQKTTIKKLQAYIEGNLEWIDKNRREGSMLLAMYYFSHVNPALKQVLLLIHQQSVARVKAHLDDGNQKGDWQIEKTELVARTIHNLLMGEMIKAFYEVHEMALEERIKVTKSVVKSLVKASSSY